MRCISYLFPFRANSFLILRYMTCNLARRFTLILAIALTVLPALAADPATDKDTADRLIAEALKPSALETNLRRLTDEIGGRVPGTPAFQRAVDWGVAAFKDAGADSVHTEEFASRNHGGRAQRR